MKYSIPWESSALQCWLWRPWLVINHLVRLPRPCLCLKITHWEEYTISSTAASRTSYSWCLLFKTAPTPKQGEHNAHFWGQGESMQERLGRATTGPCFAALQCTINFCSFTGCGLSDPVTVSNMIWFLRGYFSRAISLFSFILPFVICSKYTEFQFLSLYKSMSRRLHWLLLPQHESGWSWVTIPSHLGRELGPGCDTGLHCDEGVSETGDSFPGLLAEVSPGRLIHNLDHSIYTICWCRKGKKELKQTQERAELEWRLLSLLWCDVW